LNKKATTASKVALCSPFLPFFHSFFFLPSPSSLGLSCKKKRRVVRTVKWLAPFGDEESQPPFRTRPATSLPVQRPGSSLSLKEFLSVVLGPRLGFSAFLSGLQCWPGALLRSDLLLPRNFHLLRSGYPLEQGSFLGDLVWFVCFVYNSTHLMPEGKTKRRKTLYHGIMRS